MKSPHLVRALVRLRWAGLLVLAALTLAEPSLAAAKSVQGNRYDITLTVADDGTFHVTERLQATFSDGPFHFGFRDIPLNRVGAIGHVAVAEESGGKRIPYALTQAEQFTQAPATFEAVERNGTLHVEYGFAPLDNGQRTFVIEYDATSALRVYLNETPPNTPSQGFLYTGGSHRWPIAALPARRRHPVACPFSSM
ncbi:MAG: DUF2207 domain-containing protein, partial [Thermomicrobiales bacterium]